MTLTMTQGDDRTVRTVVNAPDDSPYVWTGSEVWFTAKLQWTDEDDAAIISLHNTVLGQIDLATPGIALSNIPAAATKGLTRQKTILHYDVQVKNAAGKVFTIESGDLLVTPEVTVDA